MQQEDVFNYKLEKDLYRIIEGYYYISYNNQRYKVIYPSTQDKYEAVEHGLQYISDNKYDLSWPSDQQIEMWLNKDRIWYKDKADYLEKQEKYLDATKVMLYKEYINVSKRKNFKREIKNIKDTINQLLMDKHSFDYLTLQHAAENIKNEYLITKSIVNPINNTYLFDIQHIDTKLMQAMTSLMLKNNLSATRLREIAKSNIWHSYYSGPESTFINNSILQNDDQRNLVKLSKMYDSVRSHPEAPGDDIIEDDDALDGWFIDQREKSEKDKKKNDILARLGGNKKLGDSGEIFVMAETDAEAREIQSLNDDETRKNVRKAEAITKQKGSVSWTDFEHVRQEKLKEKGLEGYDKVGQNK